MKSSDSKEFWVGGDGERDVGALVASLIQVLRLLRCEFAQAMRAQRVSAWEALVLILVHQHPGLRLSDLSRRSGFSPSTLTGIVDRLESGGLVRRLRDPEDRRGVIIEGTPALAAWMDGTTAAIERDLTPRLARLPAELFPRLNGDLRQLLAALHASEPAAVAETEVASQIEMTHELEVAVNGG